jgi:hypothetical protein
VDRDDEQARSGLRKELRGVDDHGAKPIAIGRLLSKSIALLETATKEIIKSGLKLKILDRFIGKEALAEFVDGMSMNGKTSLLRLLKASGRPSEYSGFIEAVRRVRNAYAHNIKFADLGIMELIKPWTDKSHILKNICNIATFDEAKLIAMFEKDGRFLRFAMLDATTRILFYAYHIALKKPPARLHKSKPAARGNIESGA